MLKGLFMLNKSFNELCRCVELDRLAVTSASLTFWLIKNLRACLKLQQCVSCVSAHWTMWTENSAEPRGWFPLLVSFPSAWIRLVLLSWRHRSAQTPGCHLWFAEPSRARWIHAFVLSWIPVFPRMQLILLYLMFMIRWIHAAEVYFWGFALCFLKAIGLWSWRKVIFIASEFILQCASVAFISRCFWIFILRGLAEPSQGSDCMDEKQMQ